MNGFRSDGLPPPDAAALADSAKLTALIRSAVEAAGGAIPFSEYMHFALYSPGLGYYRRDSEKFGPAGDFVTAPETSSLFGQVLAGQLAEVLESAAGNTVLELGAGSGRLALSILHELSTRGCCPDRYLILELSAALTDRQRAAFAAHPELAARVEWLERLPSAPIDGVILANEVADALAVERFRYAEGRVDRLGVRVKGDRFAWSELAPPEWLEAEAGRLARRYGWSSPYESELCRELEPWVAALAASLGRGALLVVDYGLPEREYYHPQRSAGTLVCHYRHRAHGDPFLWPGLTDLSAWVDFSALARAGEASGLALAGYCTQAHFLLGGGIAGAVAKTRSEDERYRLSGEIQRLTLPGEMGEAFKVIALTRSCPAPSAFAWHDMRPRL